MNASTDNTADVEVGVTADELEAEIIRALLESEGIPARVAYRSQMGLPRGWSPAGLGFGPGNFAVRVPAQFAAEAREVIGSAESQRPRPRPPSRVVTIVATLLLIGFLLPMWLSLSQQIRELFR